MSDDTHIYRKRFGEEDIGERIELWETLCRHWFSRFIPPDSRVLDLGAGGCEFINAIQARERIAFDHNPDTERYAGEGVRCIIAEMPEGLSQLESCSIDRVMASNVFEHLPDREKLFACLSEIHRILVPGGKVIVMQPNIAAVKERFYDFSDHSLPLTDKGMNEALQACRFTIEESRARFLPYTTKARYPRWPFLVRLYLLFPPVHWIMGGQMFIVARKEDS